MDDLTAYHESGHAVMAYLCGARVESLSIDPDWDDGPDRYGDTVIVWNDGRLTKQGVLNRVKVALAGPVAEMISTGDPWHPAGVAEWQQDWKQAWQLSEALKNTRPLRMQLLEATTLEVYRQLHRDEIWEVIATLTDHLLAHEILEADQIEEILSPWFGMGSE
ncbi:MAG: M50 family metallopeptidase [Planctomycetaceae bacterium]|nr:M50 family metallopeptidase [Planctomycetaceae bacterium]